MTGARDVRSVNRNRTAAAEGLLAEIEAWAGRTHTQAGKLGAILFRHAGFVALLRKRLTVSPEKEATVRAFIAEHPTGVVGIPIPPNHMRQPKLGPAQAQRRLLAAINDSPPPCSLCGTEPDPSCRYPSCPHRKAA